MDINTTLAQLGLTKNESDIYLHLLKKGQYSGASAYKELNLDKSSFYRSLNRLQAMNLVRIEGEKRNQKFFVEPVAQLVKIQQQKLSELEAAGQSLTNLAKELEAYASKSFLKNNIQIFEGANAYYEFMEQKLIGKIDIVRDITVGQSNLNSFAGSQAKYDKYVKDYIKRRVAKGIKIRMLVDDSIKPSKLQISNAKDLKEGRHYNGKLNIDCFLNVFGDRTGFMTEKAGKFWGIIIKDNLIAGLMAAMFDAIWQQSEII